MRRALVVAFVVFAIARFGAVAYSGLTFEIGDFYSTLPGKHVERLNPRLWSSPDLTNMVGKNPAYRRGPTQFLTAYPLSFLDSYRQISLVLLALYAIVIVATAHLMYRTFADSRPDIILWLLVLGASLAFYPTLQAYVAREFEIVTLAATALLVWAAVGRRYAMAGALTSYVTLYKFLPVAILPYLVARRWWFALAGFVVTTIVILGAAHAAFGLQNFSSDGFVQNLVTSTVMTMGSNKAFCDGPFEFLRYAPSIQDVSVRFALCGINAATPFPVVVVYLSMIGATLASLAYGFLRAERAGPLTDSVERWRRTWELSAVILVYTTFFYAHYYYLTLLILPLTALLVRAYEQRSRGLWAAWTVSYLLLSAFLLPLSALGRWLGQDLWSLYLSTFAYLPGELLLLGTLLYEYVTIPIDAFTERVR